MVDHAVGFDAWRAARSRPTSCTLSPASVRALATVAASFGATTAIMPRPQLNVRSMSSVGTWPASRSQRNTGGAGHRRASRRARSAVGQAARHVAGQAAAGDVGQALDGAGGADRRQQRLDVDARGLEQRLAKRAPWGERARRRHSRGRCARRCGAPAKSRWNARRSMPARARRRPRRCRCAAAARRARRRRPRSPRGRSRPRHTCRASPPSRRRPARSRRGGSLRRCRRRRDAPSSTSSRPLA